RPPLLPLEHHDARVARGRLRRGGLSGTCGRVVGAVHRPGSRVTTRVSRRSGVRLLAPVVAVAALLSGCTSEPGGLAAQYEAGGGDGYVSRDGRIVQLAASDREEPVAFGGVLDTGETIDSEELRGQVLVVNFWYAACPPCREEAPDLEAIHQQYADAPVTVIGVNVRDTAGTALKFEREHGVSCPALGDSEGVARRLARARGAYAPPAAPAAVGLGARGRAAARGRGRRGSARPVTPTVDERLAGKAWHGSGRD